MAIGNTDLGITLGARVDTSQAQKDINAFTRNDGKNKARKVVLDVDVNTKEIAEKLDHAIKMGYTNKVKDTMQKISTDITRNLTQTINGETFGGLTKVVERFKSDLGEIQERVTVFREGALKPVAHSLQTVKEGVKDVSTTTNTVVKDIDGVTTKVTTLEKVILDTNNEQHKIITTTKEWVDEQNRLHQEIKVTDENEKQLSATQKTVIDDTRKAAKAIKEMGEALNGINNAPKDHRTSKITYVDKNGVKTVKEMVDGIDTLITKTREYTTAQGVLTKETKVFNKITGETRTNVEVLRDRQQEEIQKAKELEEQTKREAQAHRELLNEKEKALNQLAEEKLKKEEIIKTQKKLNEALVSTTTSQTKGKTTQWGDTSGKQYEALITTIRQVDKDGKTTIKTIEEFTDAQGRLVQQTRTTDENLKKIAEDEQKISDSSNKATTEVKTFGQALSDAISRLAKYYIASLPIQLVRKALSESIVTIKEFDSALIEFKKVSDLAGESLTNYVAKLAEMGELTGSTMQAMVEASTQFRKSGFNDEDSAKLASVAEMFRNVADSEISAADSASFIIAQMKAFNIEAENSQHIIDAVNEVSNHFAVSSSDLSDNLGKVSAALAVNGVKYEEMLGMMTAITEVTRNASTASRGLNMISSRLVQTLDESSSTGKKLVDIYNNLGITLKDEKGQLRGTYDILKDLANQWNKLSGDQQKYIALTSAGARQTQNFVALMENFSQAIKATEMAYNSSGSAAEENARVMDSIEKKVEILRSEFQQLVIGKGGLQDFAKGLLDIGISALKLVNSLGGLSSVLVVLTGVLISLNLNNIINGFTKLSTKLVGVGSSISSGIDAWKNYIASLRVSRGEIAAVEVETATLSATMKASIPIIGLIITALSLVTAGIIAHNQKLEEQKQKIRDNISAFSDEYKVLENASERLKDENISREELNNIIDSNLDQYDAERLKLLDVNNARQETIDLIEAEKKARAQELLDTGLSEYEESLEKINNGYKDFITFIGSSRESLKNFNKEASFSGIFNANTAQEQIDALTKYKYALVEARKSADNPKEFEKYSYEISRVEKTLTSIKDSFNEDTKIVKLFNEALKVLGKRYNETTGEIQEGAERWGSTLEVQEQALRKTNSQTKRTAEELNNLKTQYNITEDAIDDYIEAHQEEVITREQATDALINEAMAQEEASNTLEELEKTYKDALSSSKSLVSSIKNVGSALEEQNEKGSLSIDTQLQLIESGYALALTYDEETGACRLNEEAVVDMTKAKLEAEIAALKVKKANLTSMLQEEASAAIQNAQAFLLRAKAMNMGATSDYAKRQEERGGISSISGSGANWGYVAETESRKMYDAYSKDIEALQNMLDDFGKNGAKTFSNIGSAAKGAGKSAKDAAKDAAKEAQKALEETKKKYDQVIKWISKQYDKEIDNIKKAEKEALKAEEAKIKAKEKEKDNALDALEKEIKALEREKNARKKYWDDRIDALKKQNEATKEALELQEKLDALEKAKNTRVKIYKEGQGFVYDVDQTAVAKAQKELDEYLSEKAYEDELERLENLRDAEMDNYEQRIEALNEYKDKVQESYEEQIAALNEHKEQLQAQYEAEIEIYENYKQQFEDMVNAYEEEQNKLLAQQLTGIDFENKNWMTRLDNLQKFVNEYNKLQKQIGGDNTNVSADKNFSGGGGLPSGSNKNSSTSRYDDRGYKLNDVTTKTANIPFSNSKQQFIPYSGKTNVSSNGVINKHASGTSSIKQDEIAIVGENPNQEIVIGSKINNGELMNLGKGTGVVNADSSKTLAGMLNQVGQFGSSGFGSGNGTLNNNINNDSLVINGVTVQGANIKDPETFVNGLLNLKAEALQRAYRHR